MLLPEPLTKGQCPHVNSHDFHIPFENVFLIRKHLIFSPFNRVRKKTVNFPPLAQRPHRCEEPAQRRPHLLNCSRPHRSASQVTEVWMRTARAFCSQRSLTQTPRHPQGRLEPLQPPGLGSCGSNAPAPSENSRPFPPGPHTQPSSLLQCQLPGSHHVCLWASHSYPSSSL